MTNKIILIILTASTITFLSFACSSSKKDKDCNRFRTGDFLYHFRGQQGDFYFSMNRNDSIQTEINQQTGDISKFAIKWTDECKYELKLMESTINYPDSIQKMEKNTPLKIEIISSTGDYYIFKSKRDDMDFILIDTLWIKR
jgi:hypothetical protein